MGPTGSSVRVTMSWTVAGGIAWGGVLVGILTLSGSVSPGFQLLAAPVLYVVGVVLGLLHGGVLAILGRPEGATRRRALLRGLLGGACAIPLVAFGWVVTAGMSLTADLVREVRPSVLLLCVGAWLIGAGFCFWAGIEGILAVRRALARWRHRRVGSALTAAILAIASAVFLVRPPSIGSADIRIGGVAALALAGAVTLWVALPLVVLVLRVAHDHPPFPPGAVRGR